jgi:hypothetical protein
LNALDESGISSWIVNNTLFSIDDGLLTSSSTLEVGDYTLLITVEDLYGNELSVTIEVHVLPGTTPTSPTPIDPVVLIVVLAGAGGVVVVIIIIVVIKKKGT